MNTNESRTLWVSIGAALFAVFLLYSWSQDQKDAVNRTLGSTKRVVIATQDIAEMETIDGSKVEQTERPVNFVEPEAAEEPDSIVGQVAAAPIRKGEQILKTKLLLPGAETGLSLEVSPGKRAMAIPIDDMRGVSRLLRPGDRIDLIAAVDSGTGANQHREIKTLLQNVPVLATGLNIINNLPRRFELDADGKRKMQINLSATTNFTNITVEVKPEEVQQLIFILSTSPGSLFVTLRHPNDQVVQQQRSIGVDDVLGRPTVRTPSSVAPPTPASTAPSPRMQLPQRQQRSGNRGSFKEL
jgi:pilus assembly protein CpaB